MDIGEILALHLRDRALREPRRPSRGGMPIHWMDASGRRVLTTEPAATGRCGRCLLMIILALPLINKPGSTPDWWSSRKNRNGKIRKLALLWGAGRMADLRAGRPTSLRVPMAPIVIANSSWNFKTWRSSTETTVGEPLARTRNIRLRPSRKVSNRGAGWIATTQAALPPQSIHPPASCRVRRYLVPPHSLAALPQKAP